MPTNARHLSLHRPAVLALIAAGLLSGCGLSDDEVTAAVAAGVAAEESREISDEIKRQQDFDSIAKESVSDMDIDTDALNSL